MSGSERRVFAAPRTTRTPTENTLDRPPGLALTSAEHEQRPFRRCLIGHIGVDVGFVALLITTLLLAACEPGAASELAVLEGLSPPEIEPGEQLLLSGSGFVVGPAELVLEGTLSAAGQAQPRHRREKIVLPVLATSATTASARLGRRHFDQLEAAHTTFIGKATLRFPTSAGANAPTITASLDELRLELFAGPTAHQADARRVRQRGLVVLQELGIGASILPEGRGLLIERVGDDSLGERVGLRAGEVIVSCGSLTVASMADLAPPPRSRRLLLGVRDIEGDFRRVSCNLNRPGIAPDADRIAALAIATCALLCLVMVAGPARGLLTWLGILLAGKGRGPREVLHTVAEAGSKSPAGVAASLLLFAASPFIVLALARSGVVVVAGLVLLVSVAEALNNSRGWKRLEALWRGVWRILPLILAAAVAAAHAASVDLTAIAGFQGAAPWSWIALSNPACLMLLVVVVAATCAGDRDGIGPFSALLRGLAGALVAAVLLGGWALSADNEIPGQLLFAAKSWIVGLTFVLAGRSRSLFVIPVAALLGAAALALMVLPLPEWTGSAGAWGAGAAVLFWVLPLWLWHSLRSPTSTSPAHGRLADDRVDKDPEPAGSKATHQGRMEPSEHPVA